MKELKAKILEALISALPITLKEAAFFGITIQQEKEILMMVVEKEIKDKVLNALYSQMGMAKQAKGIAFSLPVSDVAGLVQIPVETTAE